jgi:hypothetical protein
MHFSVALPPSCAYPGGLPLEARSSTTRWVRWASPASWSLFLLHFLSSVLVEAAQRPGFIPIVWRVFLRQVLRLFLGWRVIYSDSLSKRTRDSPPAGRKGNKSSCVESFLS